MLVAVGIAARATQWTFFSDFDREVGTTAREDPAPGLNQLTSAYGSSAHVTFIMCESRQRAHTKSRITCYPVSPCHVYASFPKSSDGDHDFMAGASLRSSPSTRTGAASPTTASL